MKKDKNHIWTRLFIFLYIKDSKMKVSLEECAMILGESYNEIKKVIAEGDAFFNENNVVDIIPEKREGIREIVERNVKSVKMTAFQ